MFSEALAIMDRNTVNYMIDELKAELAKKDAEFAKLKAENERLLAQLKKQQNAST